MSLYNKNIRRDSMKKVAITKVQGISEHQPSYDSQTSQKNLNLFAKANTVPIEGPSKNIKNSFYAQRTKVLNQRPSSYKAMEYPDFLNSPATPERYNHCINSQSQPHNVGLMNPLYINIRPNPRKMYSSHNMNTGSQNKNKKENGSQSVKIKKTVKVDPVYENIVNEMNDYFQLMRLSSYKTNHKMKRGKFSDKQFQLEKNRKVHKAGQWTQDHLNIVSLKPNPFRASTGHSSHKLITQEMEKGKTGSIVKYHSSFMNTDLKKEKVSEQSKRNSKSSYHFSYKGNNKKLQSCEYFGKIKQGMLVEEINKIKVMYYKDLIWKCCFNRNVKVVNTEGQCYRFFVGKGNNSRLIKAILNRRWWWKLQAKEQNAQFLWTQLKVYSIYHGQSEHPRVEEFEPESEKWQGHKLVLGDLNSCILSEQKYARWKEHFIQNQKRQIKSSENLECRKNLSNSIRIVDKVPEKVSNHIEFSRMIGNKKALYKTMMTYFELIGQKPAYIPLTFHVTGGLQDDEFLKFLTQYYKRTKQQKNSIWIIKPGEMSNRGAGIKVCHDLHAIKSTVKNKKSHNNGKSQTYLIQEYIHQPFLYYGRKFDIRHFIMITSSFGRIQGYFYQEGYLRTSSYKYHTGHQNSLVHLTNDALQKKCKQYGRHEKGNKVSYEEFQKYLQTTYKGKFSFYGTILPKIRQISMDIINGSYYLLDPKRRGHNFQIFGIDVMIDSHFKPWLIEVNTNPCLELSSPILAKLIPKMVDNAFTIALDPLFPPPSDLANASKKIYLPENYITENKFQLIFDESVRGASLNPLYDEVKNFSEMEGYGSDEEAYESAEDDYDY